MPQFTVADITAADIAVLVSPWTGQLVTFAFRGGLNPFLHEHQSLLGAARGTPADDSALGQQPEDVVPALRICADSDTLERAQNASRPIAFRPSR